MTAEESIMAGRGDRMDPKPCQLARVVLDNNRVRAHAVASAAVKKGWTSRENGAKKTSRKTEIAKKPGEHGNAAWHALGAEKRQKSELPKWFNGPMSETRERS